VAPTGRKTLVQRATSTKAADAAVPLVLVATPGLRHKACSKYMCWICVLHVGMHVSNTCVHKEHKVLMPWAKIHQTTQSMGRMLPEKDIYKQCSHASDNYAQCTSNLHSHMCVDIHDENTAAVSHQSQLSYTDPC
jgi:hypothetical protein